ncbi:AraC family transcriptional regulator [Flavobacterium zepuense]|uniref:AraC family transcriptional regulator n=1 Tax=Flavobacterium zepuense TaxID=2593302 RepID=A0A552V7L0_9FLAO|nr:helix-turn-helix domain-containing protein [Flavobacterium zepuense]TRW26449.1 AraC family transcriptional regulator [Flavobacterium zepuense]
MHREFEPPIVLKDAIKCFWYEKRNFGKQGFEVVPDGYTEIIFYFGDRLSISDKDGLKPLPSPFMIGLLNNPVAFYSENTVEIIAIRCYPWAVFNLLGLPSNKSGVSVFEHPVASLQPDLQECINSEKIDEAVNLLQHYLGIMPPHSVPNGMLNKAGAAMRKANGTLPVNEVAGAAHATIRTLERKFKESSGHTVKDISGLIRFEQVRNQLLLYPDANLAGLAEELGYADQSHLSREFKRYCGTTPAAFARKAKKGE